MDYSRSPAQGDEEGHKGLVWVASGVFVLCRFKSMASFHFFQLYCLSFTPRLAYQNITLVLQYTFSLSEDGYFLQNGSRFVAVGVNYWPASSGQSHLFFLISYHFNCTSKYSSRISVLISYTGVQLWNFWPEAEIQHDLDVIKGLGFNTYVTLFSISCLIFHENSL